MQALNIFHVLVAIAMVAFILVQRGPGATAGAAFGSGASGTVFGARGAGSFLSRSTWVLATLFCLISLVMAVVVSRELSQPDTDLGVIGAAVPVEETVVEPLLDLSDPATDLPALDMDAAPSAGDMPALDSAPAPEAPGAADEGSGDSGSGAG